MERFVVVDKSKIEELKKKTINTNTTSSTCNWVRVFQSWAKSREYQENLNQYDVTLESFYAEVRKQNGQEYEPDSLAVMLAAIDRYLREKNYPKSIIKDKEFRKTCWKEKHVCFVKMEWEKSQTPQRALQNNKRRCFGNVESWDTRLLRHYKTLCGFSSVNILDSKVAKNIIL